MNKPSTELAGHWSYCVWYLNVHMNYVGTLLNADSYLGGLR